MSKPLALDVEQVYRFLEQYLDWNAPKATIKNELARLFAAGIAEGEGRVLADPQLYDLQNGRP